jgi:hypothetical protein
MMVDSLVRWQASTVPARVLASVASTRPGDFLDDDRERLGAGDPEQPRPRRAG